MATTSLDAPKAESGSGESAKGELLIRLQENVYIGEGRLKFIGMPIPIRMTVIVLSSGDVWVHSPLKHTEELQSAIDKLGPVKHIVAPNKLHHVTLGPWVDAYPNAFLYAAPMVAERRPDLHFHEVLSDEAPAAWADDIEQICHQGSPFWVEVMFFHKATKTLIVVDIVENLPNWAEGLSFAMRVSIGLFFDSIWPQPAPEHHMTIMDLDACRNSLDRVLQWPFEVVILAHGDLIRGPEAKSIVSASWDRMYAKVQKRWKVTQKFNLWTTRLQYKVPDPICRDRLEQEKERKKGVEKQEEGEKEEAKVGEKEKEEEKEKEKDAEAHPEEHGGQI